MDTAPRYPFELPEGGTVQEVAPGVYWVCMPVPFALHHINLWLLEDGDGWTLVDTGMNLDETKEYWQAIFASVLGGKPLKRTIVTHFHPDHLGLGGWLQETMGSELWMTFAEWMTAHLGSIGTITNNPERWTNFYIQNGLPRELVDESHRTQKGFGRGMSPVPEKFRRIVDGETIPINGRGWQVTVRNQEQRRLWAPARVASPRYASPCRSGVPSTGAPWRPAASSTGITGEPATDRVPAHRRGTAGAGALHQACRLPFPAL